MGEIHGSVAGSAAASITQGTVPSAAGLDPVAIGWLSWNMPPWLSGTTGSVMTTGSVYGAKVAWPYTSTALTTIGFNVATAGATLSGSQVAVFDTSGNRLAAAASADAAFLATGFQTVAMSIAAGSMPSNGYVYVAFLAVGTTGPALVRGSNGTSGQVALGATGANLPFAGLGSLTAQASIPATATMASNAATSIMPFVALK
jgi:hypothetical protein